VGCRYRCLSERADVRWVGLLIRIWRGSLGDITISVICTHTVHRSSWRGEGQGVLDAMIDESRVHTAGGSQVRSM